MKFTTRIVTKKLNNELLLVRDIDEFLYPAVIGQTIKTQDTDGKDVTCTVKGISDSVYNEIIYRYIEVAINKIYE